MLYGCPQNAYIATHPRLAGCSCHSLFFPCLLPLAMHYVPTHVSYPSLIFSPTCYWIWSSFPLSVTNHQFTSSILSTPRMAVQPSPLQWRPATGTLGCSYTSTSTSLVAPPHTPQSGECVCVQGLYSACVCVLLPRVYMLGAVCRSRPVFIACSLINWYWFITNFTLQYPITRNAYFTLLYLIAKNTKMFSLDILLNEL